MSTIPSIPPKKGILIAVCGIDGSGKSTQVSLVRQYLLSLGRKVLLLKQPTDFYRSNSVVRRKLDENDRGACAKFMALLSAADRILQVEEEIVPALNSGVDVVMDRYIYSALSYMQARGIEDKTWLLEINKFAVVPDITFFVDVPEDLALQRVIERDGQSTKKEEQDLEAMRLVRNNFRCAAETYGLRTVDGTQSIEEVSAQIVSHICKFIRHDLRAPGSRVTSNYEAYL